MKLKSFNRYIFVFLVSLFVLVGCESSNSKNIEKIHGDANQSRSLLSPILMNASTNTIGNNTATVTNEVINIFADNNDFQAFFVNKPSDNFTYKLQLGATPKDVYLLFTNPESSKAEKPPVVVRKNTEPSSNFKLHTQNSLVENNTSANNDSINIVPKHIRDFNENPPKFIKNNNYKILANSEKQRSSDVLNDTKVFYDGAANTLNATLRKVVVANNKTLNIWVSDDTFGAGCGKIKCVTQDMINIVADEFLKDGDNNDIYEYVTNIVGDEWKQTKYNELIDDNDEITVLFLDIDNDNTNAGATVGYFYAKNNFKKTSNKSWLDTSNERIMFYMDSVIFASEEGATWDINDYWPNIIISTLAHEFQHMIHFYQKNVTHNITSEIWLNEMCSMLIEDIVADKIGTKGTRNVNPSDGTAGDDNNPSGRLPKFIKNNYIALTDWYEGNDVLKSYSISYSFGAFLIRNYGGTELLKKIVQNDKGNYESIVNAVNSQNGTTKIFSDLLKEWGVAVLLSDNATDDSESVKYEYNIADYFLSDINGLEYKLGSINMYNYGTPTIYTNTDDLSGDIGKYKTSNVYYKVGSDLIGDIKLSISLDPKSEMTVIVK